MKLVGGGTGAETTQALRNMETILKACGATLADLIKVNALGAAVEIDGVAYKPKT